MPAEPARAVPSPDESVGYLLSRARSAVSNAVHQRTMALACITSTQAATLLLLESGSCVTGSGIAREYGLDASAVTRLIDRLEARELIARVRSLEDRRVIRLQLTAAGSALTAEIRPIFANALENLLRGFSEEEIGFLKSLLRRFIKNSVTPG